MKTTSPLGIKLAGLLGSATILSWMSTLDYKAVYHDRKVDLAGGDNRRPRIYIFWHENILMPVHLRGHTNVAMLLSRHRDADVMARLADQLGFECVRGSTFAGGATALRELEEKSKRLNLAITPDGPRGPRRRLAQGCVFLASRLRMPIVAMGLGYDRPWRARSWDRFAIPRPFTRARGVISPELRVPPNLDRTDLERYRLQVESVLNRLTSEAEAWAEADTAKVNQVPVRREPERNRRKFDRIDPAHELSPSELNSPETSPPCSASSGLAGEGDSASRYSESGDEHSFA